MFLLFSFNVSSMSFFSTKIVDYRSCYWASLNNFAMLKL